FLGKERSARRAIGLGSRAISRCTMFLAVGRTVVAYGIFRGGISRVCVLSLAATMQSPRRAIAMALGNLCAVLLKSLAASCHRTSLIDPLGEKRVKVGSAARTGRQEGSRSRTSAHSACLQLYALGRQKIRS